MNVLVVNAKSPASLSVIRSLGQRGIEVTGASDDMSDFPLYSKYCHNRIHLKSGRYDEKDRVSELLDIVSNQHFDVLMPVMSQPLLFAISKHKSEFEKHTRIAVSDHEQFGFFNNKATFTEYLMDHHLPCPKTFFVDSEEMLPEVQDAVEFPVIIKPRIGEGANGVKVIDNKEELTGAFRKIKEQFGPVLIQQYVKGIKHTAVFLTNKQAEVRRFFVHRAIREYPVTGGPTCFLESIRYEPVYQVGLSMIRHIGYHGLVSMEFIIDEIDNQPKIIDVNPRFYGPLQCAITAGTDLPFAYYEMLTKGDIDTDLGYKEGKTSRHLLFEDAKHLVSILKGTRTLKYNEGRIQALISFLNFTRDDSYFILSRSDLRPAVQKFISSMRLWFGRK